MSAAVAEATPAAAETTTVAPVAATGESEGSRTSQAAAERRAQLSETELKVVREKVITLEKVRAMLERQLAEAKANAASTSMMDELQAERAHSQQLAAAVQELQALVDTVTRDADAAAAEAAAEMAKAQAATQRAAALERRVAELESALTGAATMLSTVLGSSMTST